MRLSRSATLLMIIYFLAYFPIRSNDCWYLVCFFLFFARFFFFYSVLRDVRVKIRFEPAFHLNSVFFFFFLGSARSLHYDRPQLTGFFLFFELVSETSLSNTHSITERPLDFRGKSHGLTLFRKTIEFRRAS